MRKQTTNTMIQFTKIRTFLKEFMPNDKAVTASEFDTRLKARIREKEIVIVIRSNNLLNFVLHFDMLIYLTFPSSPPSKVKISRISLKKSFRVFSPLKISSKIFPSFKNKIRSQKEAQNGSCVTIKIVA